MFSSLVGKLEEEVVDNVIQPIVHSTVSQKVVELRGWGFKELPSTIKGCINDTAAGPKEVEIGGKKHTISAVTHHFLQKHFVESPKAQEKLDRFSNKFTTELEPVILDVTKNSDNDITDYTVLQLKVELGLAKAPPTTETKSNDWPPIPALPEQPTTIDTVAHKVRTTVRDANTRILPDIVKVIPPTLESVITKFINQEIQEGFEELKHGWKLLDGFVDWAERGLEHAQKTICEEIFNIVWGGMEPKITLDLKAKLVELEQSVADSVRASMKKIPGF
ncbi:hypothetical protein HK103_005058 [Boothiomyces macroporosus]|uniref:Uncharacterized protein n=1 Tax=Boothiomyces macroporosus TaxID=261099 RepID=A0AAD5UIP9_9FUNG|nr:hypothetical protein HK103_005058 [Boothiomyces macroporosus]